MSDQCRTPQPQPADSPSEGTAEDATEAGLNDTELTAFITQGRWLLDYHGKRVDSTNQRAVAILGFVGVLIALVPNAIRLSATTPALTAAEKWTTGVTVSLLVVTASLALATLAVRSTHAPGVMHLRQLLHDARIDKTNLTVHDSIVETMLHGLDLASSSPIDDAAAEAATRARLLKRAVWTLATSILGLAFLVFQLFIRI